MRFVAGSMTLVMMLLAGIPEAACMSGDCDEHATVSEDADEHHADGDHCDEDGCDDDGCGTHDGSGDDCSGPCGCCMALTALVADAQPLVFSPAMAPSDPHGGGGVLGPRATDRGPPDRVPREL